MSIYKNAPFTKVTELTNSSVSKLVASTGSGKELVNKNYANDAAAIAAGLIKGDIYHNAGALRVVIT
jgi:hypothetical protein